MKWNMIISPLYTHWRHRLMLSDVGKGCDTSTYSKIKNNPSTAPKAVFCPFHKGIEEHLHFLHSKTRTGDRKYQSEIDRYIVACLGQDFQHLILPRGNAPHYDNLPDFSFYAISILDPSKDGIVELQQIFLLLRQCTPLRRRTKRAQRELQWESYSIEGLHHLIISMQGTLLGLYPSCARSVAFITRVQIYRFVRSLLVADFQTLNECLQRIRYILKISVMEHLCNTITDYHPGIRHMLNKAGQQLQHFCNAVTTMCDIFRGELNTLFVKTNCIFTSMIQMEKSAHSFFERCTRAYRGIITNHTSVFSSLELLRKRSLTPSPQFISHLKGIYNAQSQYIFELVHKDLIPQEFIESFWHLTQCIAVHPLPVAIRERQYQALCRKYPEDSICIERCRKVYVCIYCSIKRNITGGQLQCAKIRKDCTATDGTLLCANCNVPSILVLDILGRVANVGDQKIILSSCCASLIYFKGSGREYDTVCGEQCARQNQFSKGRASRVQQNEQWKKHSTKRPHCYVCSQKNIVHTFELLNVEERRLVRFHLCSKHNLSNDLIDNLGDELDLVKTLKCNKKMH
jgi:hypothetical protein